VLVAVADNTRQTSDYPS